MREANSVLMCSRALVNRAGRSNRDATELRLAYRRRGRRGDPRGALLLAVFLNRVLDWNLGLSARDPLAVADAGDDVSKYYVGWVTYVGVVALALAAGVAFLAAWISRASGNGGAAGLLAGAGGLSLMLCIDDLFMLHDRAFPIAFGRGDELFLVLGLYAFAWAFAFRQAILRDADAPLLLLAATWFGLSLGFEFFEISGVYEEATKLLGITSWLIYSWRLAVRSVAPAAQAR